MQTFDGGNKWSVRTFGNLDEEEEINYRFQKVEYFLSTFCILPKRRMQINKAVYADFVVSSRTAYENLLTAGTRSICGA